MRQYNRGGNLSPRSLASALPQGPPYSLVNGGQAHTREAYRDLLIFEERLKQNSERLASQRRKYEAFLLSLILSIALLSYKFFISPSPYTLFQFLSSGLLLIGIVTLILFFATGVYSEKIAYAYKFVPQANRALRYFNIYLNTKKPPRNWSLFSPLSWFRISSISNGNATSTTSPGLSRVPSTSGLRRASRSRSPTLSSSFSSSSSPSSPSPTNTRNVIPLAPLPPASNPRGELIFSSKVSTAYREGYEKYRSDWEKRRKLSKPSTDQSYSKWIMSFVLPASWIKNNKTAEEGQAVTGKPPVSPSKKKKLSHREGGGNSTSVSHAATPSEYSDSSSVEHHHPPAATESRGRGRDATTRPLLARSGSSSSITSSTFSTVTTSTGVSPISRRSSPLRQSGVISVNIPISSRSSPSTPSLTTSKNGIAINANQTASSGPSSRASTPDLIPEEEDEEDRQYPKYYPHNGSTKESSQRTGASSPSSVSSSSISIATSGQSLLFSNVPVGGGDTRRRQYLTSATSDDSLASTSSSNGGTKSDRRTSRKSRRYEEDDDEDEDEDYAEDDDALRSPPDMSPHSKEAALSDLPGDYKGMKNNESLTRRRSRASSFNEFLDELREDGL